MKGNRMGTIAIVTALVSTLGGSTMSAQDKYTLKVPGGLAFSEFRGYEAWQVVSVSQDGPLFAARSIGTRKSWRRSPPRRCRVPSMTSTSW